MEKEKNWLEPDGIYNPILKFAFTNITEEPFDIKWDGNIITTLKAGETVELNHYLAVACTKALIDKIMMGNMKLNELEYHKNNPNGQILYRASSSLGVPSVRREWQNKICRLMETDEESPQVKIMRATIREELKNNLESEPSTGSPLENAPASIADFADLNNPKEPEAPKTSPIKLKKIKEPAK